MKISKILVERVGLSLSVVCAIHCLTTPVLLAFMPAFGNFFSEKVELMIVIVSFLAAVLVQGKDFRYHKNPFPLGILSISFGMLTANLLVMEHLLVLDISSSLGILWSYILNWQKVRQFKSCTCPMPS
ncbi:MAG: MerC domain-containing protein [Thermonemataceae bacterium]|nr:MerC domain-containing protein [Thermonemataceae bacterium]